MARTISVTNLNVGDLLGGPKVVGVTKEPTEIHQAIREGLPYAALEAIQARLRMTGRDVTAVLGIPPRTMARRKQEGHLSPIESDRLYRLASITHLAAQVLGDLDRARAWLSRTNRALGGLAPFSLLDTEVGTGHVKEVLIRTNYGMYS